MPDSVIKVIFESDTSSLKQGFKDVNDELASVASKGAAASKPMAEGVEAVGIKAKESSEHLSLMGKAAEKGREIVKDFGSDLVKFSLGAVGVAAAFEMVKKAVETSMESETMHVRLATIIGDADKAKEAIEQVDKASDETRTSQAEGLQAMQTLLTAGTPFEGTAQVIKGLEADVRIYGGSLEGLTDIYARMQLKGDEGIISVREMNQLVQASGGASRKAAEEYAKMDHELELNNALVERNAVLQQRAWAVAKEARDASRLVESEALSDARELSDRAKEDSREAADRRSEAEATFAKATGADAAAFRQAGGQPPSVKEKKTQAFAKSYGISEADAEFYMAGQNADPGLIAKSAAKQSAGKAAISAQGYDVSGAMASGDLSADMLLSENQKSIQYGRSDADKAESRGRADTDKARERERAITDKMEVAAEKVYIQGTSDYIEQSGKDEKIAKRGLAQEALEKATNMTAQKHLALGMEADTKAGLAEGVQAQGEKVNAAVGDFMSDFFDRMTHSFGAANKNFETDPETGVIHDKRAVAPKSVVKPEDTLAVLKDIHSVLAKTFA